MPIQTSGLMRKKSSLDNRKNKCTGFNWENNRQVSCLSKKIHGFWQETRKCINHQSP